MDQSTEAIVLRVIPWSENDLIVHLLTPALGKQAVIARGARKSRKRFSSCPDTFDRGTFAFRKGRGTMPYLSEFTARQPFKRLRDDILKLAAASVICECFDYLIKEDALDSEQSYALLESGLGEVDSAAEERLMLRSCYRTVVELLEISGFEGRRPGEEPGLRALAHALEIVEHSAERKLQSKNSLLGLIKDTLK